MNTTEKIKKFPLTKRQAIEYLEANPRKVFQAANPYRCPLAYALKEANKEENTYVLFDVCLINNKQYRVPEWGKRFIKRLDRNFMPGNTFKRVRANQALEILKKI